MAATATPVLMRFRSRILVASADALFRKRMITRAAGTESTSEEAFGGAHALAKLEERECDGVLLDQHLPDLDATEVAALIRKLYPRIEVEIVDSKGAGAEPEENADREINREVKSRHEGIIAKNPLLTLPTSPDIEALPGMIGDGPMIQQVYRLARMVAPRDTTVLITGETGTGKELVAEAIHKLSPRARQPFVVLNCAAIPEALLEAELFGHARGAFTGAVQSRLGRAHVAQGGTLFLDEIGELPLSMQAKLLRFLQNGEVQRLGSSDVYRVDVRVVCATNVCLEELVESKQCRKDLYFRLAVFPINLPSLRERPEDIAALAESFLAKLSADNTLPRKSLSSAALALLQERHWTGNVRELHHALERAFILAGNETSLVVEHFQNFGENKQLRGI